LTHDNSNAHACLPKDILEYFISIQLWNGAMLVLDRHSTVIKTMALETKLMADLLSTFGRRFSLIAMWEVIRNKQDLLGGVLHKKRKLINAASCHHCNKRNK